MIPDQLPLLAFRCASCERPYTVLRKSEAAWNTRQAAYKALQRDHGGGFDKAGVVLKCEDIECGRFIEDHQDELIRGIHGNWIRKSEAGDGP